MAKKVTGGCSCGSIRYELLDKPMFVHCCHCDDCQRLTGSAFVLNAIIETQAIKKPDVHIYTRWKAKWLKLPKQTPSFRNYYNSSKLWPKASLRRRNVALGKIER
jgi:hypothetical protein